MAERLNRRYQGKLRVAMLREKAAIEDLDYTVGRGLEKVRIMELASSGGTYRAAIGR